MPLPEKYYQQLIESHAAADRASRRDAWRALARVLVEITGWTALGMLITAYAFHVFDVGLGRVYWLVGCIVWIGGVSTAVLSAYRRGEDRGDW